MPTFTVSLTDKEFHHREHKEWLSQLNFYQDEIKFFQNELLAVLHAHNDHLSIVELVDEYRDLLMKKLRIIDELRMHIILHEKSLVKMEVANSTELWAHAEVRERINEFVSEFEIFKQNFRRFAAHND
ncbi:MAG: hypothetical protein AAFZ15_17710 [Bacteroidota bacterium]